MGMKGPIKGSMISAGHRIYFDNSLEGLTPLYWPLEWDTWNMWEIEYA
jgi:hypothetical protein